MTSHVCPPRNGGDRWRAFGHDFDSIPPDPDDQREYEVMYRDQGVIVGKLIDHSQKQLAGWVPEWWRLYKLVTPERPPGKGWRLNSPTSSCGPDPMTATVEVKHPDHAAVITTPAGNFNWSTTFWWRYPETDTPVTVDDLYPGVLLDVPRPAPNENGEWLPVFSKHGHAIHDDAMVHYVGGSCPKGMQGFSSMRGARAGKAVWFQLYPEEDKPPTATLTGNASDYYLLHINVPARANLQPYTCECLDVIDALGMTFAEGEAFKAIWRSAAARNGNGKPGTTALYDAEKVAFYGARMVAAAKRP